MSVLPAMTPPISGQCLCGNVTYTCNKAPVWSVNCHCRSCQKLSGAPYVSAFSVPADSFNLTGETISFQRQAEAGHLVTTTSCAKCGSRIHAQSEGARHLMNFFASTLSDPSHFVPISNAYVSEAAPWLELPKARFNFPKMPQR